MAKIKSSTPSQRALVIGVSRYPAPISKLPGVANDIREVAKVLGSRNAVFKRDQVSVVKEKQATKKQIESKLKSLLANAKSAETVFAFFAGHGAEVNGQYYFIAHDTDVSDIEGTGVSLQFIKGLFDKCKSKRAFLWLDFCHSGGIIARRLEDEISTIKRELKAVRGEGKVIIAACTKEESAYESSAIGHGFFTHALLRGLKGEAKSAQGEVTAGSLYDFIDHQVSDPRQQPIFSGEMKGRIVLMHYGDKPVATGKKTIAKKKPVRKSAAKAKAPKRKGTWILLGDDFFCAENVKHKSDGSIEVNVIPSDGSQQAVLASLQTRRHGSREIPFAVNNDGHHVQVTQVEKETVGDTQTWTMSLKPIQQQGFRGIEFSPNGMAVNEVARRRAGRILINDPPPAEPSRGFGNDSLIENAISGGMGAIAVDGCVIKKVFEELDAHQHWKECARLKAVFLLKATGTVEHVLELKFGPVRGKKMCGQRPAKYSNEPAATIEIEGQCELI